MTDSAMKTRRQFLAGASALGAAAACGWMSRASETEHPALIAITLDLEMSAEYPVRGYTEWNYRKGDLDDATKQYAVQAGEIVKKSGGVLHYFCVGQTLEQPSVEWLKGLASAGHPIGNHTYDHVFVKATTVEDVQFRFKRAPWLAAGRKVPEIIRHNIEQTTLAMNQRLGIKPIGFRTPGGFSTGLQDRPDVQKVLLDLGFKWSSSLYPTHLAGKPKISPGPEVFDDILRSQKVAQPFTYPTGLVEIPMSPISDVNAFRSHYWKLTDFLKAIETSVGWAIETGSCFDFLAHPSCLVIEDPKLESIQLICDLVRAAGKKAKITSLEEFAGRAIPKT